MENEAPLVNKHTSMWTMDWVSTRRLNYGVSTRRYDLEFCKSGSAIPNMTFSTRNFDPLTSLSPKFPNFAIQILLFRLKHTVAIVTHAHVLQNYLHHLGTGCCLPKTTFRTKVGGGCARGASKKLGTPYIFLQPLKLATSNLVHNLGLGLAYQKMTFRTKIGGGLG